MDVEDDLEYDITFPTPGGVCGDYRQDAGDDELLSEFVVTSEVKEPVVILIGWAGCKDKYLSKYSKIYEQQSCITIRYIPPKEITFIKPHCLNGLAVKMLDLLCDYCLEENPIFFHVFSNNGCYFYSELSRILHSKEGEKYTNLKIKGLIVDSGPGRRRLVNAARAYAFSTGVSGFMRIAYFFGMFFYLFFLRIYLYFSMWLNKANAVTINPHKIFEFMMDDKARWPQLFLYSTGDTVIPSSDIDEIVTYRREVHKVCVDSECYDTAEHVALFREHPESYTNKCRMFINDCLSEDNEQASGEC